MKVEGEANGSCRLQVTGCQLWCSRLGRLRTDYGDEAVEARGGAEAVAQQVGVGGDCGGGLALVLCQLADEGEDVGDVGGGGGADAH